MIRDKLLAGRNAPDKVYEQVPLFFGGLVWVQQLAQECDFLLIRRPIQRCQIVVFDNLHRTHFGFDELLESAPYGSNPTV